LICELVEVKRLRDNSSITRLRDNKVHD
jgi:hypothetical protein